MTQEIINLLPVNAVVAVAVIAALAFVVSAIIEVIKNIGPLAKVPTDIVVVIVAVIVTVAALFVYAAILGIMLPWYYIVIAVVCGFIVAYIAMYGWDKINALWQRYIEYQRRE
jgi:high-affinity Fe2+/Pb2+ permease